jgi:hypothetical protein
MRITDTKIKQLERRFKSLPFNKKLIPPILFPLCKKQHPEMTDAEIDSLYEKAGVLPVK